jgi:hypothetical protein
MSRFLSRTALRHLRLAGPLAIAAATLSIGSLPALAQSAPMMTPTDCSAIHFSLANPGPGSRVEEGTAVVQGVAMDTRAGTGAGIDRVDFFLDNRDSGGTNIGTAAPGMVPGPFGPGSFQTTISFPNTAGGHDLFAYAHSSVTGQESIIDMPIAVGEDPIKAGETSSATATATCTKGGNAAAMTTPAMTTPAMTTTPMATTPATTTAATTTTTTTPMMAASTSTISLSVGNPSPGDTVHVGAINISGSAWDKAAMTGSGIDRVDIFLDSRDSGGMLLTQATLGAMNNWQATVTLPSNQTGLHTLNFYAHSSVTGQEMLVSVPVTIAPGS